MRIDSDKQAGGTTSVRWAPNLAYIRAVPAPFRVERSLPRMVGALSVMLCFGALTVSPTRQVWAAPSVQLVYHRHPGAESCPDEAAVRAAVAARLGYAPFRTFATTTLFAEVLQEGGVYLARIKLVDDDNRVRGTRELRHDGDRCSDMIEAMALSMSIAIDPHSLMRKVEPTSTEPSAPAEPPPVAAATESASPKPRESQSAPASPPPRVELRPRTPPAESKSPIHFDAGLGQAIWFGAAPGPNASGNFFARAHRKNVSLALEGRVDLSKSRALPQGTVQTSMTLGSLVGCAHFEWLGLCAAGVAGSIRATSHNVTSPRHDSAFQLAVGPRVVADVPVGSGISLGAHADSLLTLREQTLQLNGANLYTLPRVSVGGGIGLAVRFF